MSKIKDYAKAVVANKATFSGYALCSLSPLDFIFSRKLGLEPGIIAELSLSLANIFLIATDYGRETYNSYMKTREHIGKYNNLDVRFKDKYSNSYCTRKGVELAAKEAGLEDLLNKK